MPNPFEKPLVSDSATQAIIDKEIKDTQVEISKQQVVSQVPPNAIDADKDSLNALKHGDKIYVPGQKGKKPNWVKDFEAGKLQDVTKVHYDYPDKPGVAIQPGAKGPDGLPLPGTPEYDARWKMSKDLAKQYVMASSMMLKMKYNNPLDEAEIELGATMCTAMVFKHFDKLQNQAEAQAGIFVFSTLIPHMKYHSVIDGREVSPMVFALEKSKNATLSQEELEEVKIKEQAKKDKKK